MSITIALNIISIVSACAAIISAYSAKVNAASSRKNITNFIQNLVLQKANECNKLWKEIERDANRSNLLIPLISEIIITFQLLDNCLDEYKYKKKRNFLLRQFWTQWNTSLRLFIQYENADNYTGTLKQQILDIKRTLQPFMP